MISRVADHCFWLGRYLERAESTARVLHVTGHMALDAELPPRQVWAPIPTVFGEHELFGQLHAPGEEGDGEKVQHFMTWEERNPSSLVRSLSAVRDNARSTREVVSLECWEVVNELYLWMRGEEGAGSAEYARNRHFFYRHLRREVQLCLGLVRSTMLHDTPLDFIWLGAMLERAGQTARTLDVHHHAFKHLPAQHQVVETALWLSLLRACSGFESFMKTHQGRVTGDAVAAFLLFEPRFPRSIRYCLESAHRYLRELAEQSPEGGPGQQSLERIRALLQRLEPKALEHTPHHELLTHVVDETAALGGTISAEYFGLGPPPATATASQSMG